MDKETLVNLQKAYQVSPSPELAKVIIEGMLDSEINGSNVDKSVGTSELNRYLSDLARPLEDDFAERIYVKLSQLGLTDLIVALLDETSVKQAHLKLQSLIDAQNLSEAKQIYQKLCREDEAFQNAKFERLFNQESAQSTRPKLKVIEKTDVAEVTNLTRYREQVTTFEDVVGLEDIKAQIRKKIILPFQKPSLFQRFKKKVGGGVLLYGPPGCGKTLLARAAAGECNARFFNIEISDVLDMYIGESEQKLHAIFEKARGDTPCVLFFDELEALAGKREHSRNNTTANVVSQFLSELDGFAQNNSGVLVLASTNVPWSIDSAFLRPGRFDRMFFVPPPDKIAREAILKHHIKQRPHEPTIDYSSFAQKARGFSGADLFNLVEMASDEAIDESIESGGEVPINESHFKTAIQEAKPTTVEWLTTARNYARYANDGGRYDDVIKFLKKHGKF